MYRRVVGTLATQRTVDYRCGVLRQNCTDFHQTIIHSQLEMLFLFKINPSGRL